MITGKWTHALARTLALLTAMTLGACSASTHQAARADTDDPESRLPEIVITATRLPPARLAEQTELRPPAKRGG